jgi:hypothetical protein
MPCPPIRGLTRALACRNIPEENLVHAPEADGEFSS